MIAVIDYGVGNLFSLTASLNYLGLDNCITSDKRVIQSAAKLILPGVGAFGDAYRKLEEAGLVEVVKDEAKSGKPLLGICLGMQMLFDKSYEHGEYKGLGLIKGEIRPIKEYVGEDLKIPHMGWNSLRFLRESPLTRYIKEGVFVYYVHSYCAENCVSSLVAASDYGTEIAGIVENGNVFGTQFHPEKSGKTGLNIIRAFAEIGG